MLTRPELGVCTWTFGDLPLADIGRRVAALGFDGVELLGDLDRYSAAEAREILDDHGLQIFSLTPANVDLAHPDGNIRRAAIDYYRRLVDFAGELGSAPLISCHGFVGRVRPVATVAEERALLREAVGEIAAYAELSGLRLVLELLNRYESHLLNTAAEGLAFVADLAQANVGLLLDAYHMNIEEPDPGGALREAGGKLWLYHVADSNRQAIGRGHIKFSDQLWALESVGYAGPIILECTAPGADPFRPIKDAQSLTFLETYLRESVNWF